MARQLVRRATGVLCAVLVAVLTAGLFTPAQAATRGVNDWNCRPSGPDREPVIMLHGLGASGGLNWFTKAPLVASSGFCVFTPTYGKRFGIGGFNSMRDSAAEISAYVERVRAATGAEKVNLVGHSEGTTVSAYYMKFLGGGSKVRNFVGFGSNFKGTTMHGLNVLARSVPDLSDPLLDGICPACNEYLPPSAFIDDLNRGGVTVPGPRYTSIVSKYDAVVVPYTSGILEEPGVTNVVLQKHCMFDLAGHISQAADPNVTALTVWALKGQNGSRPGCVPWLIPG